ncbi:hypothetical protein HBI56_001800 [Parastagonospora nodorum]|uniref:Uncharacterized protein n=1 Tax=Phaeosphaeria nodorum (strain SN15 / ATCC MYA-4574 / FGSC 10173) TaxID=321614 RepID=A0A7U2ER08_PHANO|nr:hypothetical protein HBH56_139290 [Parastagonospora nodorum]QRC91466.1 hypothetical protein JI435_401350 [Parastagonospora nodorum SN15]KAH3927932.1 hypothetical protein HBH54_144430 [Parastagonospora nodorum]KAH3948990.1 hypothetical protein HBH53_094430 [Parastagonospora nodorum]KAH3972245.1 hypothetical protein HBH52_150830 [Parastagonospora nodorum]
MSSRFSKWRLNSIRAADLFGYTRMRLYDRGSAADPVCNMASFSRCNQPRIPVARLLRVSAAMVQPIIVMLTIEALTSEVTQKQIDMAHLRRCLQMQMFFLLVTDVVRGSGTVEGCERLANH